MSAGEERRQSSGLCVNSSSIAEPFDLCATLACQTASKWGKGWRGVVPAAKSEVAVETLSNVLFGSCALRRRVKSLQQAIRPSQLP